MARKTGVGSSLYPNGVTSIEEVPMDLMRAITHASKVLDWYENLEEKHIPPEWMWQFDERLHEHFEQVRAESEKPEDRDDRTVVPLMENEEAQGRRG